MGKPFDSLKNHYRGAAALAAIVSGIIGYAPVANAGVVVTLLGPQNDATFNNNPVGAFSGASTAVYNGSNGPITFVAGADTTGVTNTSTSAAAIPLGDPANMHYLWGLVDGTTVYFGSDNVTSFIIHIGSVDSKAGDGFDNVLTLSNGDVITGTDLVNLGLATGLGTQGDPKDNPWLLISDTQAFDSFTATSSKNAFEFDMVTSSVPEPSTWAMMLLGFASLGFAGYRRAKKTRVTVPT
jgi:hypothetical protein